MKEHGEIKMWLFALILPFLFLLSIMVGGIRIINQGNEALVERFGRYQRKLGPGISFIFPLLDYIVLRDSTREQILDIPKQGAITRDNVSIDIDAVAFWRIIELEKTYYAVEDVEQSLAESVTTEIRSTIGTINFEEVFSSTAKVNKIVLKNIERKAQRWGVEIRDIELQEITPSENVRLSMQMQQAAQLKKKAAIIEAEGAFEAIVRKAEGTAKALSLILNLIKNEEKSQEVLNFLIAQDYVEANQKIGESENSKVIYMDPNIPNSLKPFTLNKEMQGNDFLEYKSIEKR